MREITIPILAESPAEATITDLLTRHLKAGHNPALFALKDDSGQWLPVSAQAFYDEVMGVARGLMALGVEVGDRVAIMCRTRYEWTLVDFAVAFAGAVSVPVYDSSSPSQIAWILEDSGAKIVIAETAENTQAVHQAIHQEQLTGVRGIYTIDEGGIADIVVQGVGPVTEQDVLARAAARGKRDIATIIYTSGTTGRPKGCELTHANFVDLADNALQAGFGEFVNMNGSTLMFLPLAHVFGRFIAMLSVGAGAMVGHTPDLKTLMPDLASFRPTYLLSVPRVFEKVYNSSKMKADSEGKGKIFAAAARTAEKYSQEKMAGRVALRTRIEHAVFDKLVYSKLRKALGGRVQYSVSGGGPLGDRLAHFFNGVGLTVLEGYGLTETTAPVGVNTPEHFRIGTVGRPLPGDGYRIAEDGEVLVRGICVFKGYFGRPDLTAESFDGEWFRTGDLGELDDDGFLKITGRKKEIIVTAGGKNVVPAKLEDQIRASALVSQTVVVGDGRPFVAALVTLDEEALPGWLERHGKDPQSTPADLVDDPELLAEIQQTVDHANESVSRAESVRKFVIIPTDFTEETGHLTPSLKLKRGVVLKDFADAVDKLYSDAAKERESQRAAS